MNPLVERLAREAGFTVVPQLPERPEWVRVYAGDSRIDNRLECFAALLAQELLTVTDDEIRRILSTDGDGCVGKYGVTDGEVIDAQKVLEARRAAFPMPKG